MPALAQLALRVRISALIAAVFAVLAVSNCAAQKAAQPVPPEAQWTQQLEQHPEMLAEFGQLLDKIQHQVHLPVERSQSRLLPLLPESTVFYAALPNYGDAANQALNVFHQQLQQSATLRNWWTSGDMATAGPQLEQSLAKFYEVSQYLGDEIVLTGTAGKPNPGVLLVAEIKKPGLKPALQQMLDELSAKSKSKSGVRILDVQELAAIADAPGAQDLLVLVRPDYLVASSDVATLRSFNARLDSNAMDFASTPFGQRVARAYQDGITMVAAADLKSILAQAQPNNKKDAAMLQRTGFADVQYMVWEHTKQRGQDLSLSEMSFLGPRHGIASWLGAPSQLGSLDFASPKPLMVFSVVLANPAQMFDDIREIAISANPNAFAAIAQAEQGLKLSLQEDLLRQLGGEITVEVDSVTPEPAWKAILQVKDPVRLQQTIETLLEAVHFTSTQFERAGTTYHSVRIPSGKTATEIAYTFTDGYLVIASSPAAATEAVQLHRTGGGLARSKRFQAALPPGHPSGVSALFYQDPFAMSALRLQAAPELARPFAQLADTSMPAVMCAYGEENAIRGASTSTTMDGGVVLIAAAVAIPNLLRARVAGNEASAVGSMRTINTAQVVYASSFPDKGFARNVSVLGTGSGAPFDAEHAGLVSDTLACSGGAWCEKSGYRFRVSSVCMQGQCIEYAAVATPVNANTGSRSFCSTSNGVIRYKVGPPLTTGVTALQCHSWTPLK